MLPLPSDLVSIVLSGGTFNVSRPSRVLLLHAGFDRSFTDETRVLLAIARTTSVNLIMVPIDAGDPCVAQVASVARDFVAWSRKPAFVLSIAIRPDFVLSDETIYIGKNHVIDGGNVLKSLLERKLAWLLVKNDDVSDDPFLAKVQPLLGDGSTGVFSAALVLSKLGFKNLKDLASMLDTS